MSSQPWSAAEAFDRAPAAMAMIDADDGTVLVANRALAQRLGVDPEMLVGLAWPSPLGGTRNDFKAIVEALAGHHRAVIESRLGDLIDPVWWRQSVAKVVPDDGQPYLIIQVEDRSAEHLANVELTRAADHDELTGLWNRRRFRRELRSAMTESAAGHDGVGDHDEADAAVGLVLLDVDGFKAVNDTFGHATGDAALSAAASALVGAAPAGAAAARLSGDEFAVFLRANTREAASESCARIVAATGRVVVGANAPEIRLSAGWAVGCPGPDPDRRVHDLMIEADVAMYANKSRARAQLNGTSGPRSDEGSVADAWPPHSVVEESGFELWAHPVTLADGGEVVLHDVTLRGAELPVTLGALVRMLEMAERHSRRSVGQPDRYLIHLPDFPLGVGSAVNWLGRAAADAGLSPGSVTFALPEARLLEGGRSAHQVLASLREQGLGLAVDSFGAEVGSLRLLADLVPDQVWFDPRLLIPAAPDVPASGLDLIEVAVALVQRLRSLTGIAGVEPAQLDLVRQLGVDLVKVPDPAAYKPVGVVAMEAEIRVVSEGAARPREAGSTTGS